MKCNEALQMFNGYMDEELNHKELDIFLNHIEECKNCREELEINYILKYGLSDDYDDKKGSYDFVKIIDDDLKASGEFVKRVYNDNRFRIKLWLFTNSIVFVAVIILLHIQKII